MDRHDELDAALERVINAARRHLAAVKAAAGPDDDDVWQAYVELNNASFAYDELLLEVCGEVTPWDVDAINPEEADKAFAALEAPSDPYPKVISVRQRRDYKVPSVAALLRAAEEARASGPLAPDEPVEPVESVGEAVLELMQAADGSMGGLDIPQLEAMDGVVVVVETVQALDLNAFEDADGTGPFAVSGEDRLVDRLDEHTFTDLDGEGPDERR